mmetsp:Transcript_18069/g.17426  ORF Transcript_18069/g.17426 Transcript_18069/m.17426 type:complete len:87 (+) Transcript_18069:341-601(+)
MQTLFFAPLQSDVSHSGKLSILCQVTARFIYNVKSPVFIIISIFEDATSSRSNHKNTQGRLNNWFKNIIEGNLNSVVFNNIGTKNT